MVQLHILRGIQVKPITSHDLVLFCALGVPGGPLAPPVFGRSVNPIPNGGEADYAKHITTGPPDFWTVRHEDI